MNKIKTLLIIDDDEDDFNLLQIAMREVDESVECKHAIDGEEALKMLRTNRQPLPGLILLDLNMPRMNGRECLAELKKDNRLKNIPVVIYSTSSYQKDIDDTRNLGAADYLMKPSGYKGIINALTALLNTDWKKAKFQLLEF